MWIKIKTTVRFEVPNEYKAMCEFEAEHPDFRKELTTNAILFTKDYSGYIEVEDERTEEK